MPETQQTTRKTDKRMPRERILTVGAHNDDYIVGAGGTLAGYSRQGVPFWSIVFSYGEMSHPHIKKKYSISMRVKESLKADKMLGGSGIVYLGLPEGKFREPANEDAARRTLQRLIKKHKPTKIFTHSPNDPHPDHFAVYTITLDTLNEMGYDAEVYSFDVWNLFTLKKKENPILVVDIKDSFHTKMQAFKAHKSQMMAYWALVWNLYLKAITNGMKHGYRYCEVFDKIA